MASTSQWRYGEAHSQEIQAHVTSFTKLQMVIDENAEGMTGTRRRTGEGFFNHSGLSDWVQRWWPWWITAGASHLSDSVSPATPDVTIAAVFPTDVRAVAKIVVLSLFALHLSASSSRFHPLSTLPFRQVSQKGVLSLRSLNHYLSSPISSLRICDLRHCP